MTRPEAMRIVRGFTVAALIFDGAVTLFELAGAAFPVTAILAGAIAVIVTVLRWQTRYLHRKPAPIRPAPDYAAIARMEREVYGETFGHEGAPRRLRMVAGQTRMCGECGVILERFADRCPGCYPTP